MKIPRKISVISKYLLLNARVAALLSVIVIALITIIVLKVLPTSLLTEIQVILIVLTIALFFFLFFGLYYGIRLQKDPPPEVQLENIQIPDIKKLGDFSGIIEIASGEGGIFGILLMILVWMITSVVFILLYPEFFLALAIIFYWIFYWAYRVVFAYSRKAKGNIIESFGYSIGFTILYTGWFFILMQAIKYFRH